MSTALDLGGWGVGEGVGRGGRWAARRERDATVNCRLLEPLKRPNTMNTIQAFPAKYSSLE